MTHLLKYAQTAIILSRMRIYGRLNAIPTTPISATVPGVFAKVKAACSVENVDLFMVVGETEVVDIAAKTLGQ